MQITLACSKYWEGDAYVTSNSTGSIPSLGFRVELICRSRNNKLFQSTRLTNFTKATRYRSPLNSLQQLQLEYCDYLDRFWLKYYFLDNFVIEQNVHQTASPQRPWMGWESGWLQCKSSCWGNNFELSRAASCPVLLMPLTIITLIIGFVLTMFT